MRDNIVDGNHGHGHLVRRRVSDATMVHNITRATTPSAGLSSRWSDRADRREHLDHNVAGIQAGESSNVQVWNNTIVANTYAFKAYKGFRTEWPTGFLVRTTSSRLRASPTCRCSTTTTSPGR